jgi:hypothetical protein
MVMPFLLKNEVKDDAQLKPNRRLCSTRTFSMASDNTCEPSIDPQVVLHLSAGVDGAHAILDAHGVLLLSGSQRFQRRQVLVSSRRSTAAIDH